MIIEEPAIVARDGKVVIDPSGNIQTQGKITANEIAANKLIVNTHPEQILGSRIASDSAALTPTIGSGKILAGQTSTTVNARQVTSNSKIFVTPRAKIGTQALVVDSVNPGVSFIVSLDHPLSADLDFDWWLVEAQ